MATVKVKFRHSSIDERVGSIYYQVIHNRTTRQLNTAYKVYACEWDEQFHRIVVPQRSARTDLLVSFREKIRCDMERFNRIIVSFERQGKGFDAEDVLNEFLTLTSRLPFFGFMEGLILKLKQDGKRRTSETYRAALNSFSRFRNDEDVMLDAFDRNLVESYEAYLLARGLVPNSVSFHMRILRAVYNRACEQGLIAKNGNPFSHVYTGVEKTAKRAVGIDTIRRIKNIDLTMDKAADYARDIFMLSFYMRGISFIDLAYLKKTDLHGDTIVYRRRKTGQKLTIRWTKEMQAILEKYPSNATDYLCPVITSCTATPYSQYRNRHYKVNKHLKTVARKAGLRESLTTYVARHSWASIAKAKGVAISIISEGLGHDCELTTQIYLSTLDTSAVDRANDMILSAL